MSQRTPWSHSSLPSDRLKPQTRPPANPPRNKGKAKDAQPPEAPPKKSAAVRALDTTIEKLQNASGGENDPQGGCFCQARTHGLSPYTPLCARCGLVLCTLNPPYRACPHCSSPLLSAPAKAALLERLRDELAATLAREADDAARAREEARLAAGAFPQLAAADSKAAAAAAGDAQQTHKVLSLNARTKRVTVASYAPAPPAPVSASASAASHAHSRSGAGAQEARPARVPPPPREVARARGRPDGARPWADVRGDGFVRALAYVRDPQIAREEAGEDRRTRKAKKAEGTSEVDGGSVGISSNS